MEAGPYFATYVLKSCEDSVWDMAISDHGAIVCMRSIMYACRQRAVPACQMLQHVHAS